MQIEREKENEKAHPLCCIHLHALQCFFKMILLLLLLSYCILSTSCRRQKMETVKKWNKDFIALNQLETKIHSKQNGKAIVIAENPDQG